MSFITLHLLGLGSEFYGTLPLLRIDEKKAMAETIVLTDGTTFRREIEARAMQLRVPELDENVGRISMLDQIRELYIEGVPSI